MVIGVVWVAVTGSLAWDFLTRAADYKAALTEHRCQVVEGTVEVMEAAPRSDRVRVGEVEFTVFHPALSVTYQDIIATGGELRAGAKVRLHYYRGAILRVEVRG